MNYNYQVRRHAGHKRPNAAASAAAAQPSRFAFAQNRTRAAVGLEAMVRLCR